MGCILAPLLLVGFILGVLAWVGFELNGRPAARSWRDRAVFLLGAGLLALLGGGGIFASAVQGGEVWDLGPLITAMMYVAPALLLVSAVARLYGHRRRSPRALTVANLVQLEILLLPVVLMATQPLLVRLCGLRVTH